MAAMSSVAMGAALAGRRRRTQRRMAFPPLSSMPGFVQMDLPVATHATRDFGTYKKKRPATVAVHAISGELAGGSAGACPLCGHALVGCGRPTVTLRHLPFSGDHTEVVVERPRWLCLR